MMEEVTKNPVVTIEVKDHGTMTLELDFEAAPNTVRNFVNLANEGYYDGLIFHRVIKDFMIQGGGSQSPSCAIKGEFNSNGHNNPIKHERGVISMARTQDKNSATSQFFIMHANSPHLDGEYAGFGYLIDGFDVLDSIANVDVTNDPRSPQPLTDVIIESITVDTNGVNFNDTECY